MTASVQVWLPDVSHLSPSELARLRALLVGDLAAQAAQRAGHEATVSQLTGQMDVDSLLERELADAAAVRAGEAIEDIKAALEHLDNGTYGWCEECRAPIPFERLEAIPRARWCVACPGRRAGLLR